MGTVLYMSPEHVQGQKVDLGGSTPKLGLTGAKANAFSNADVGFSLGGPVVRDRLWFHAAYNPNFERQPFSLPGIGSLVNKKTSHLFAGKLTWRSSDDTDMILSPWRPK